MKRILVIEDDSAVRALITETLQFRGWEPLAAANGVEGVSLAKREQPDLILCDIQMPELDGYGVLRAIRENPATMTLPFVFLTGLSDKPRMRQAMEAGADDYLIKPFTVQELIAAVEARLQKQAVFQETADRKLHELRESITFALPHELVTPLNTILGFSSLLLDSPGAAREEVEEYASHIREAGQRLRKLVEKFLLYAQVELISADADQRAAHRRRTESPTSETIMNSAIRVSREYHRETDLEQYLGEISHGISQGHLERLVRELVENACSFSEPGTKIQVRSLIEDGEFEVQVSDFGRGFSEGQIKRIGANLQFDRKLQEQQGTGLGLAISRRIAELYGGVLDIQSTPGKQTVVTVRLPVESV
jgi:signal transduction histidine kinase